MSSSPPEIRIDALLPHEMAAKAEQVGVKKAGMDFTTTFALAFLAGAFIALGAVFATTMSAGGAALPYGVSRLLAGIVFSLGLILVVVGGAELFTGNNLIVMAWASGQIKTSAVLRNWVIVYLGNLAGSVGTALVVFLGGHHLFGSASVGATAMRIAAAKTNLDFVQAIALGALCNILVCLAVWLTFSARTVVDRVAVIVPPITAFVACGFEHSVANMYFIPSALFIKQWGGYEFWSAAGLQAADFSGVTWTAFIVRNLIPVTIGNIIGGAAMVGAVYWFIFLRNDRRQR